MKVLHKDRNSYHDAESASLNLRQLWEKFRPGEPEPTQYGQWQDWNYDMVPKFMMGNGLLVRTLVHTGVHKYLEFKAVDGSYVFKGGKVYKVRTRATSGRTVFRLPGCSLASDRVSDFRVRLSFCRETGPLHGSGRAVVPPDGSLREAPRAQFFHLRPELRRERPEDPQRP